ncbi:MAG: membrane protein insertase YidC [Blastocatellia bacterium]
MEKRLLLFFLASASIFIGWQLLMQRFFPPPPAQKNQPQATASVSPGASAPTPASTSAPTSAPATGSGQTTPAAAARTQAERRTLKLGTDAWKGVFSNQGATLTSWTMTRFVTNGKMIDPPTGVNLIAEKSSQDFGGTFRFYIPADNKLADELNAARWEVKSPAQDEIQLAKGQKQEILFAYNNGNGLEATKKLVFSGDGYDFEITADVKRGGQPVPIQLIVGPNFGDQSVKPTEYGAYKTPPRVSYSYGGSVSRDSAGSVKTADPHRIEQATPIVWAGMDDGYFAMVLIPGAKAKDVHLFNVKRRETHDGSEVEQNYLSVAIPVVNGQASHIYAGPKDIPTLEAISRATGLGDSDGNLVDILDYGIFSYVAYFFRPLAAWMLKILLWINSFTRNYGWAIVILTVAINMLFFPLRWRSSIKIKKAASLQPKFKELQDRMKKIDKNDPRMLELQKEQIALMKEGNILSGCLPLLLQMPFFTSIYLILTVSIEVRREPFFAWMRDLSSPDPIYLLPVIMCLAMILQTKLTPTPPAADPAQAQAQKMMQYVMPVMLTVFFFIRAPLGLVLYWMVGNIVGVIQQYVINKLSPAPVTTAA